MNWIYDTSPCLGCIEKACNGCACAVCEAKLNQKYVWWSTNSMEAIAQNSKDCDKFIERLWRENESVAWVENDENEMVLDQNWRGFPVKIFSQDDWFHWVDAYHSKGVGWVYENIKA